ncbi:MULTISPECIES: metal-dependent hydrolase [Thermoanaerobacterium]|uniref:Membrane-bound metal-dependent hydrolase n=3 Tax=Thermoanaerobacterium TaxID=28895 RepID=W9EHB2_9THEO|nr:MULTISPECIES: metal-dependent hydrolase [Thermoanaerobacterium]AFK94339.1 Protein of unknown function DUF457, transmembrane [Thermoanaerobacterium saccharolyticum JW/SL-YS485]AGB20375.1 putative membrane-bound metal-dependent hydrolase (DUF457) [Thermoanaerobacterium thermosaccharolyticum M0795]ETO39109.1 hypothetical protein V518_0697 [Thermoanaerobacterium aotearoense SCUT27]
MLGKTHIALGLAGITLLTPNVALNQHTAPIAFTTVIISSLLPDIDDDNSLINHKIDFGFKPLGSIIISFLLISLVYLRIIPIFSGIIFEATLLMSIFSKHRSFSHSMLGFLLYLIGIYFSYKIILVPFAIGYSFHLLADMITNSGIELFYPFRKRIGINIINTGSIFDKATMIVGVCIFMIRYFYKV